MNRGFPPNTPDGQLMFKEQNVYFHACTFELPQDEAAIF
jgi:hypothetical protein